ncbi:MAG: helix-turn-helix domain-containing protein [Geodermatophilaceae bacterium]|nr:helix-turn-helix domain-containing protein [Geodermatophilaceae bacterium]
MSDSRQRVARTGEILDHVLTDPALDEERCYRAVSSRDSRFDGWFYVGVLTTGIYCRPSCPATTPKRTNVRFYAAAGAAQTAGLRACRRCRPDAVPGSPQWNVRADLVGRAMRLIADGLVERDGIPGLARHLGYSERHLTRQLMAEVGAGPLTLARAQRANTARLLIETTGLPMADVAFASGFASVRQFNETIQAVFASTPTHLRRSARPATAASGTLSLRLPFRPPFDVVGLLSFLVARAVPGIEEGSGAAYRRTLLLPHGHAVVTLSPADRYVACTLRLTDLRDLAAAVQRCRGLLDLDADPVAVAEALGADPWIGDLVRAVPGRRLPGAVDATEISVRAVLGQQISVAGARTLAARLVRSVGDPLPQPDGLLTHTFPTAAVVAAAGDDVLAMPATRRRTVRCLAAAVADGRVVLNAGVDRADARRSLLELPGVGPWTASYICMRGLGDPDVFLDTDLGVRKAMAARGIPDSAPESWRPWRSYAVMHLWDSLAPTARRA